MKKIIRFGSRKSLLAVAQTNTVIEAVRRAHPEFETELVTMETTGDINMKPFSEASDKFGIKGLFTKELEEALLDGRIDIAVHSLKDMPMYKNEALPTVAFSKREDPRDALVLPIGTDTLSGHIAGCSSARRRLQLRELFPDITVEPVRGNVITRLRKLDEGQFSMLVLAAAGLNRIGMENRIFRCFSCDEMIPAPGQGILACQGRADEDYSYLKAIEDDNVTFCAKAERAFSAALGGGCTAPVGAYAEICQDTIFLRGFYADEAKAIFAKGSISGKAKDAAQIGAELADRLRNGGTHYENR